MIASRVALAKKYATAYLNMYGDSFEQDKDTVSRLQQLFVTHKQALILLGSPGISSVEKWKVIQTILADYNVTSSLSRLVELIVMDGRAILLPEVLTQILLLFYKRNHIMLCTITSSHMLNKQACEIIQHFMSRQTGCDIIYEYTVDPSLIAGIRVVSDTSVWEYSLQQQLRNVNLVLIR